MWKYVPFLIFFLTFILESVKIKVWPIASKSLGQWICRLFPLPSSPPPPMSQTLEGAGMPGWMHHPWTLTSPSPALKGLVPSPHVVFIQRERGVLSRELHSSMGAWSNVHRGTQRSLGLQGTEPGLGWGSQVPRPHHLRRCSLLLLTLYLPTPESACLLKWCVLGVSLVSP